MNEEELSRFILEQTTESLKNKYPQDMGDNKFGGYINLSNPRDFFNTMRTGFLLNGVVSNESPVSQERKNLARASAFAVSAVTGLYMSYALSDSIDEFFADPANANHFNGYSEEQKTALRNRLKDTAKERLAVEAKTDEGKALVQKLTEKFESYAQENEQNGASQSRLRDFQSGLSALNSVVYQMVTTSPDTNRVLDTVKRHTSPNDDFVRFITDALESDSAELAQEEEVITRTVATFDMKDADKTVNVEAFLNHYTSENGLDEEEKDWAVGMFDKLGFDDADFANFMAGGNPLFTAEELDGKQERDKKIDVIANALMGNNVIYKENGKETLVSECIAEYEKSWFEKFIDLIKEALGIGKNERLRANLVKNVNEDFKAKKSERISFEELSGLKALEKVTGETERRNERTAGMGGRTR